jgi:hypothetical protein
MTTAIPATPDGGAQIRFSEAASSALRYWEPRRLLYNAVLFAVVVAHFWEGWPASRAFLQRDMLLGFFVLAVLANVAYCAAYAVDLFVQFSGARSAWPRWRWSVLAIGIAFASVLAHFITQNLLQGSGA